MVRHQSSDSQLEATYSQEYIRSPSGTLVRSRSLVNSHVAASTIHHVVKG